MNNLREGLDSGQQPLSIRSPLTHWRWKDNYDNKGSPLSCFIATTVPWYLQTQRVLPSIYRRPPLPASCIALHSNHLGDLNKRPPMNGKTTIICQHRSKLKTRRRKLGPLLKVNFVPLDRSLIAYFLANKKTPKSRDSHQATSTVIHPTGRFMQARTYDTHELGWIY